MVSICYQCLLLRSNQICDDLFGWNHWEGNVVDVLGSEVNVIDTLEGCGRS